MVIVICVECGKQYDVERGSNISDFKCECGGKLGRIRVNSTQPTNLIDCPDCGHKVSKKAKNCPNCGRHLTLEDKGKTNWFKVFGWFILLIIILYLFYVFIYYQFHSLPSP
jgi:DNA-directed RNA polymerase subunit RPC12/RpoP